jgi:hypothetical protein
LRSQSLESLNIAALVCLGGLRHGRVTVSPACANEMLIILRIAHLAVLLDGLFEALTNTEYGSIGNSTEKRVNIRGVSVLDP